MNIKYKNKSRIWVYDYEVIFWDFDGVIKESVSVKTDGFAKLFRNYGHDVVDKVINHHLIHSGTSRYIKIPFYFKEYVGIELTENKIEEYCNLLSELTNEAVVNSPWVPGVEEFLKAGYIHQQYYIISGTPQKDIDWIVNRLNIGNMFLGIYGSPMSKIEVLSTLIMNKRYDPDKCMLIGDSIDDFEAASKNNIDFLLRSTPENHKQFNKINCPRFHNFKEINEPC